MSSVLPRPAWIAALEAVLEFDPEQWTSESSWGDTTWKAEGHCGPNDCLHVSIEIGARDDCEADSVRMDFGDAEFRADLHEGDIEVVVVVEAMLAAVLVFQEKWNVAMEAMR